jgi:hypothetical protein
MWSDTCKDCKGNRLAVSATLREPEDDSRTSGTGNGTTILVPDP